MTPSIGPRYDRATTGGRFISNAASKASDFSRLEQAVSALVESHQQLAAENAGLKKDLQESERRIRALDSQLLAANQRRQDAYKRLDELIAHLDQLDAQLAEADDS